MNKNSPEVIELRKQIEQSVNKKIKTPSDFDFLVGVVWERIRETISPSTLKRIWGYVNGSDIVRESTLDQLARCLNFDSWELFKEHLRTESEEESDLCLYQTIRSEELEVGEKIEIGWQPNRRCILEYLGDDQYRVIAAENAKLRAGDTFSCSIFFKNEPMYVDNLIRPASPKVSYVAGNRNGLTVLNKIP